MQRVQALRVREGFFSSGHHPYIAMAGRGWPTLRRSSAWASFSCSGLRGELRKANSASRSLEGEASSASSSNAALEPVTSTVMVSGMLRRRSAAIVGPRPGCGRGASCCPPGRPAAAVMGRAGSGQGGHPRCWKLSGRNVFTNPFLFFLVPEPVNDRSVGRADRTRCSTGNRSPGTSPNVKRAVARQEEIAFEPREVRYTPLASGRG